MKRSNIFYISTVIVAIVCLVLDLIFPNNSFSFLGVCFAITMLVYGLLLILRGFQLKIDSSLFLGVIILVLGTISIIPHFTDYRYADLWHYLLLGISLSSFVTGVYFKIKAHKNLAILFLGLFVLGLLFQLKIYKWWIMLLSMLALVIVFIIFNNILHNRRNNG